MSESPAWPKANIFEIFTHDSSITQSVTILRFEKKGDEHPVHSHEDHGHCTICIKGSVEIFDESGTLRVLNEYDNVPQYTPGKRHGFRAREDDSHLMNITLPGVRTK